MLACVPGDDVWFLRLAIAFLAHLQRGGQIADHVHGGTVGDPAGPAFNFDHLRGGPLLWAPGLAGADHLFIGHTVCPGFNRISSEFPWWSATTFCAPGYDYLHEGLNHSHVPVDMAPHAFVPLAVADVDAAAWSKARQRAVLVHGDPIEQAATYFAYRRAHVRPAFSRLEGRPLAAWTFRDYLLRHALPSYAKLFISYQAMARARPNCVQVSSALALRERPAEAVAEIVTALGGRRPALAMAAQATDLARRPHRQAIEALLGRRLDGTRPSRGTAPPAVVPDDDAQDPALRREAMDVLASLGVDTTSFPAPQEPPSRPARAASGA